MSAKVKKLEDQFRSDSAIQRDGNSSSIFSGVAIYVNGFTGEVFGFFKDLFCFVLVSVYHPKWSKELKHMSLQQLSLQQSKCITITVCV